MKLAHDLIIPAGTEFKNVDGVIRKREYFEGNYEAEVAIGPDHTMSVVIPIEVLEAMANSIQGSPISQALSEFRAMRV